MEFGKVSLEELNRIDLKLPDDDPRTWVSLKKAAERDLTPGQRGISPRIGIGAPVWGVKNWVGKVYPQGVKPKDFLEHYSRQFNSVELNTTHYRIPDHETIKQWREATPDGFKFNVKFFQDISHRRPLDARSRAAVEFIARTLDLGDRLGISFLQLPPTFAPEDLPMLRRFLMDLPRELPLGIEVRHPAFFSEHRLLTSYFELLAEFGVHVVITDVAGRRDVLHTSLPTSKFLLRFIGNDLHPTDDVRIADWVSRLKTWFLLGLEQVEFFVHQPSDENVPELIARLIDQLTAATGYEIPKWKPMNAGTQLGFF